MLELLPLECLAHRNRCVISKQVNKCNSSLRFLQYVNNYVIKTMFLFYIITDFQVKRLSMVNGMCLN